METNEISDFVVKKVPVPPLPNLDDIAGGKLFPQLYYNAYIVAKKRSGKSTVLSSIILKSVNKKSNVIFFVSTINKDATYQYILDKLDAKGINYTIYTDIVDENGFNILDNMIEKILEEEPVVIRKKDKKVEVPKPFNIFEEKEEEQKKRKATKKESTKIYFCY
jgi:hypothetical protein